MVRPQDQRGGDAVLSDTPETIEQGPDGSFSPAVIEPRHQLPAPVDMTEIERVATVMAQSGFFSDSRQMAQAAVKVMAGRELGIPAIQAMTSIYIVEGKVTLGGMAIGTLIKRSGRYNYRIVQHTDEVCEIAFFERDGDGWAQIGHSTFDRKDAEAAGLIPAHEKSPWTRHRRNMLFNRAISNGAKWHCPDVFGGPIYTPEELGAAVDSEGNLLPVAAPAVAATHTDAHLPPTDEQKAEAKLLRSALVQVDAGFDDRMKRYVTEEIDEVGLRNLTRGGFGTLLDWMAAEAKRLLPDWDFTTGEEYVPSTQENTEAPEKPQEAPAAEPAGEPAQATDAPEAPAGGATPGDSVEPGSTFREAQELVSGNIGDAGLIRVMMALGIEDPNALDVEPVRSSFLEGLEDAISKASS